MYFEKLFTLNYDKYLCRQVICGTYISLFIFWFFFYLEQYCQFFLKCKCICTFSANKYCFFVSKLYLSKIVYCNDVYNRKGRK